MSNEMTVYGAAPSSDALTSGVSSVNGHSNDSGASMTIFGGNCDDGESSAPSTVDGVAIDSGANDNSGNCNGSDDAFSNADDALEPIDRLEKYATSDINFHRQVVARSILETLHEVHQRESDVQRVMNVISQLSSDTEPNIRAELVEQIPHISSFCVNHVMSLPNVVPNSILPILEQFLTDSNNQVRKMTQGAFVMMLDQGLIKIDFLEKQICPLLIQLTDFSNLDDYRIEAVVMMSKLVKYLGIELTEKLLLHPFTRLCMDVSFHVRRVCAANFGEFSTIIGEELTESILLPQFRILCDDSIWGVRKSCADVFVPVAIVVSCETRRKVLSPLFVNLLCDQSRWVKTAAFQALGPFISTFADPSKTGLYYSDGSIVVVEDHHSNDSGCSGDNESPVESPTDVDEATCNNVDDDFTNMSLSEMNDSPTESSSLTVTSGSTPQHLRVHVDSANEYNHFLYWRVPIPELQLDIDIQNGKATAVYVRAKLSDNENRKIYESNISVQLTQSSQSSASIGDDEKNNNNDNGDDTNRTEAIESTESGNISAINVQSLSFATVTDAQQKVQTQQSPQLLTSNSNETSLTFVDGQMVDLKKSKVNMTPDVIENFHWLTKTFYGNREPRMFGEISTNVPDYNTSYRRSPPSQDIIPNDLLEHYLSMTNPIHYQTIDPDLSHHCAYSLPAVALTLGRHNWPCLRETYELLAAEMQWKVRWTLASSLHQMSLILGSEYTTKDLLPIFLNFMKDLDEVRFGILQNLAAFLKLLHRPQQLGILPKIADFLKMDNNRNWRFRYILGDQIVQLTTMYTPPELKEYLLPIGMVLIVDKVSEVRLMAIRVVSAVLLRIYSDNEIKDNEKMSIIHDLNGHFASSSKWTHRQGYVLLCETLIQESSIPYTVFMNEMLEHMLNLANDNVPNVRIALARCISRTLLPIAQFRSHIRVQQTLEDLRDDKDNDVRKFAMIFDAPNSYTFA